MSNFIFEEESNTPTSPVSGKADIEKKARQLAYDSKYKVKQTMGKGTKMDPATVKRSYLQQLSKSSAPPGIKLRAKQILLGDEYQNEIKELVEKNVIDALTKVFVEGAEESTEKKWVVVTDKKTGNTYRRRASREKISELRANPNISRVEVTDYHPDEDEDKQGQKTAKVKAGKGLNNDGNLANNYPPYNKVTRGDVIAGAKGKDQMGGKKKVEEGVLFEKEETEKQKKITGKGVNNKSLIKVFPNSDVNEQQIKPNLNAVEPQQQNNKDDQNQKKQVSVLQQFQRKEDQLNRQKLASQKQGKIPVGSVQMNSYEIKGEEVNEKMNLATADIGDVVKDFRSSDAPQFTGKSKKKRHQMAIAAALTARRGGRKLGEETCSSEPKNKKNEDDANDPREIPTKVNLVKNKLRSMGLKMNYEPKGEKIEEIYGRYGRRQTASGRYVPRDEPDEEEQLRQSDAIAKNPKVQAERKSSAKARLAAKGILPIKKKQA
jgi:hypothetical protein